MFEGSFDYSNDYLEYMEGEECENPNMCWRNYYVTNHLDDSGFEKEPPF